MTNYRRKQAEIREQRIEWRRDQEPGTWRECREAYCYFEKMAKKYGLIKEFRAEGILQHTGEIKRRIGKLREIMVNNNQIRKGVALQNYKKAEELFTAEPTNEHWTAFCDAHILCTLCVRHADMSSIQAFR